MTPAFTLKTAPTFDVLAVSDFKLHIRKDEDDEDGLIAGYVTAARQWVEDYTGRSLCTQTWQASLDCLPRSIELPRAAPLQSVTFVKYYDADNVLQTLASSEYIVPAFNEPGRVEMLDTATWPSVYNRSDAVQVEYVTGYAQGECPPVLLQAVQVLAAHFYENREAVLVSAMSKEVEFAVTALCTPWRLWWQDA